VILGLLDLRLVTLAWRRSGEGAIGIVLLNAGNCDCICVCGPL
jgi:hypothetical protein